MRAIGLILILVGALFLPKAWKQIRGPAAKQLLCQVSQTAQPPLDERVVQILNQPFYSWSKGSQSEVFLSRDGRWVLKIPKKKKGNPCESFKAAFEELRAETALEYVHYGAPISMPDGFALCDRLRRRISFDLGSGLFALQRRVELFSEAILRAGFFEAQDMLLSLLDLIGREKEKGWLCGDFAFTRNFGFAEGRAVRLDIGSYGIAEGRFCWAKIAKPVSRFLANKINMELCDWWNKEIEKRS